MGPWSGAGCEQAGARGLAAAEPKWGTHLGVARPAHDDGAVQRQRDLSNRQLVRRRVSGARGGTRREGSEARGRTRRDGERGGRGNEARGGTRREGERGPNLANDDQLDVAPTMPPSPSRAAEQRRVRVRQGETAIVAGMRRSPTHERTGVGQSSHRLAGVTSQSSCGTPRTGRPLPATVSASAVPLSMSPPRRPTWHAVADQKARTAIQSAAADVSTKAPCLARWTFKSDVDCAQVQSTSRPDA